MGGGPMAEAHRYPLRVQWEDTDAAGIVYYANYLRFIERGRSDVLLRAGVDQQELMREQGLAFAVRSCAIDYLKPARLHEELTILTEFSGASGATLTLAQAVWRGLDELARARVVLACIDGNGRPKRVPRQVVDLFATLSTNSSQISGMLDSKDG